MSIDVKSDRKLWQLYAFEFTVRRDVSWPRRQTSVGLATVHDCRLYEGEGSNKYLDRTTHPTFPQPIGLRPSDRLLHTALQWLVPLQTDRDRQRHIHHALDSTAKYLLNVIYASKSLFEASFKVAALRILSLAPLRPITL